MTPAEKNLLKKLINVFASGSGTESVISFVAETDNMLAVCRSYVKNIDNGDPGTQEFVQQECVRNSVFSSDFEQEIRNVLSLFATPRNEGDHYKTLKIEPGATKEEIKQAYRKLSLKYHPDTTTLGAKESQKKFIAINAAYKALSEPEEETENTVFVARNSVSSEIPRSSFKRNKKVGLWFLGVLVIFGIVAGYSSKNIRNRAMIAGLQEKQAAFVPPVEKIISPKIDKPQEKELKKELKKSQKGPIHIVVSKNIEKKQSLTSANPVSKQPELEKIKNEESSRKVTETVTQIIHADSVITEASMETFDDLTENIGRIIFSEDEIRVAGLSSKNNIDKVKTNTKELDKSAKEDRVLLTERSTDLQSHKELIDSKGKNKDSRKEIESKSVESVTRLDTIKKKAQEEVDINKEIQLFFKQYLDAYKQRNLIAFSRFFTPDAKENSEPLKDVLSNYQNLFAETSTVALEIEIVSKKIVKSTFLLDGQFSVKLTYKDGRIVAGSGPIRFLLTKRKERLLIKEMDYKFK